MKENEVIYLNTLQNKINIYKQKILKLINKRDANSTGNHSIIFDDHYYRIDLTTDDKIEKKDLDEICAFSIKIFSNKLEKLQAELDSYILINKKKKTEQDIKELFKDMTVSKFIENSDVEDIDIKDILFTIDYRFEDYYTNAEMINESISILLSHNPSKDDVEKIDKDLIKQLLDILEI